MVTSTDIGRCRICKKVAYGREVTVTFDDGSKDDGWLCERCEAALPPGVVKS